MILTFDIIHEKNMLTFDNQEYIKDANNPYVFISINPVTTIGAVAFYGHVSLTKIVIPNTVTSIGNKAFQSCISLTEIIIPDSVTSIGNLAFQSCISLNHIVIPDSVTSIGFHIFAYCKSSTQVETNDENAYIIEYCKTNYPSVEVIVCHESYILK